MCIYIYIYIHHISGRGLHEGAARPGGGGRPRRGPQYSIV